MTRPVFGTALFCAVLLFVGHFLAPIIWRTTGWTSFAFACGAAVMLWEAGDFALEGRLWEVLKGEEGEQRESTEDIC